MPTASGTGALNSAGQRAQQHQGRAHLLSAADHRGLLLRATRVAAARRRLAGAEAGYGP